MQNTVKMITKLVVLVSLCFMFLAHPAASAAETVVADRASVNIRSGPGTGYKLLGQINRGTSVTVIGRSGDWYRVRLADGRIGWLAGWLVKPQSGPSGGAAAGSPGSVPASLVVTGDVVNLRDGPGSGYPKAGQVVKGALLTPVRKSGEWYQVRLASGKLCWIAGWLVKPGANPPDGAASRSGSAAVSVVVTGDVVNLRSGPGSDYPRIGQVSRGTQLPVAGQSGEWYQVRLADGKLCWIAGWLVKPNAPAAAVSDAAKPADEPVGPLPEEPAPPEAPEGLTEPEARGQIPVISREPFPVSRSGNNGALVEINWENTAGGTEFIISFCRPVFTKIQRMVDPSLLLVDISELPSGILPELQAVDGSGLVSSVRAGWLQENPPVARVVFTLKQAAEDLYWEADASPDRQALRLRLKPNIHYAVAGKAIVLDPGHGGRDTGALGAAGLEEKEFNLVVAHLAAEQLRGRGATVWLTRETDEYVDLYDRTAKANALEASVFVSIHANASERSTQQQGTSTYWYAPPADPVLGLQRTEREYLAQCLQAGLVGNLGRKDLGLYTANFVVLRTAAMPAALIEAAFVSNREEEVLLSQEWFRRATAKGIVEGLEAFFSRS